MQLVIECTCETFPDWYKNERHDPICPYASLAEWQGIVYEGEST